MPNIVQGLKKAVPADPRPSQAHPVHRHYRKKLENDHPAFGWKQYLVLGLLGVGLAMNIEKDVERCEEKHKQRDREREEKGEEEGRRRKDRRERDGSRDGQPRYRDGDGRSRQRDQDQDQDQGRDRRRDQSRERRRNQSYDRGRRDDRYYYDRPGPDRRLGPPEWDMDWDREWDQPPKSWREDPFVHTRRRNSSW